MLFNSYEYIIFYSIFFLVFFLLKTIKQQLFLIVVASLYFYGAWSAIHVLLLLFVCGVAFGAQYFERYKKITFVSVSILLSVLAVFKYYNFFAEQFNTMGFGIESSALLLPMGISFYVFQAISFVVDRKRGHIDKVSFTELVAYISFFPQLVAGPIVRASVFLPQLLEKRQFSKQLFYSGFLLFCMGMFKKVVIADNLGVFVDEIYASAGETTAGNHLFAFYFYAIQIYYDFCGYSEMAIGIARTLGFKFPRNFARPYLSASITEFWRRWHISLSSWLRDYLYISLGGNRKGLVRTYVNLALVMLFGGLWHGAAWTFVVWGALHGGLLVIERLFNYAPQSKATRLAGQFITFHIVCISWVFFRSPDFQVAGEFFAGLTSFDTITVVTTKFTAFKCLMFIPLFVFIEYFSTARTFLVLRNKIKLGITMLIAAFIFLLFGNFAESPFIYFQF